MSRISTSTRLRSRPYDSKRTDYSKGELTQFGMVRKVYTTEELRAAGFGPDPVTSSDEKAKAAEELLKVDIPFG
jgi:hypothetical protein